MKLFTKIKKEFSSKIHDSEKNKNNTRKTLTNEWLLSDEQFNSILHSSSLNDDKNNSEINEIFSSKEEIEE